MHSQDYLKEVQEVAKLIPAEQIEAMVGELKALRDRGGRLFMVGLGGSAANCSHAVNDFRKLCGIEAYTPVDNVSELTARANDEEWRQIFYGWLQSSNANKNDALFVLSVGGGTEGVSAPITEAISASIFLFGMKVLGIVGKRTGYASRFGHCVFVVPTVNPKHVTPHTESFQSVILHCIVSHPDLQIRPTKW